MVRCPIARHRKIANPTPVLLSNATMHKKYAYLAWQRERCCFSLQTDIRRPERRLANQPDLHPVHAANRAMPVTKQSRLQVPQEAGLGGVSRMRLESAFTTRS